MKKLTIVQKSFLIFIAASIVGFCILTNSSGDYRSYLPEDLPFVIQMNEDSPASYDNVIIDALNTWNVVEGSYFEFILGQRSSANSASQDNINLLYFDSNNDNFAPGTNTIAFSRTFTSNVGGYHAIESDYIYNASGYPPATNGSSNQMDLMTITLHEIGHHQGLSHHGPAGNSNGGGSAGCGENLPEQVMYWSVGLGSLKRELFVHDEMGSVAIYPNYIVNGQITNADDNSPIENAKLILSDDTYASYVAEEVDTEAGRNKRPGYVYTEAPTLSDGSYNYAMNKKEFSFYIEKFGYENSDPIDVSFNTVSGYGNTQILTTDIALVPSPRVNINGTLTNSKTGEGIEGEVVISWVKDESENQVTNSSEDGSFTFEVPQNSYLNVEVFLNPPFEEYYRIDSLLVGATDAELSIELTPASVLFVYDAYNSTFAGTYLNSLDNLGIGYVEWESELYGVSPDAALLDQFSDPLTLVWIAGSDTASSLKASDYTLLESHLDKGNRLIIAGQNALENADTSSTLFSEYAGVQFADNSSAFRAKGFEGDIIGDGFNALMIGSDKDILQLTNTNRGDVNKVLYYGSGEADTSNIAAIRAQNETEGWKFVLFADGLDKFSGESVDTLISRALKYAGSEDFVTGVEVNFRNDELPNVYSLDQNYPNPFNPSTTIKFALPVNANVKLTVFNILGEQVDVIKQGYMNAGSYELRWDAVNSSLSSGIYFYNINAEGMNGTVFNDTKKMILLK